LNFDGVLDYIDNTEFSKVKTKYSKGDDWTAISLRGYGPEPLDILKPNVLKSGVKEEVKLQDTSLLQKSGFQVINDILAKIPSTFERVRFMKIKANSSIGKHSDKIDKDFGLEDGNIVRFHVPIRTNDQVEFCYWKGKEKSVNYLEEGHYYYLDARAPHAVINNSDVDRIHLVIDVYVNDEIRKLLGVETFW
jgi:hypothetical protein